MSSNQEALSPLLIELARAVRARSFFEVGHATREHAMAKAKAVWASELSRSGELDLEIDEDGFRSPQSGSLQGASLGELAAAFQRHNVIGLQIHPSLSETELETLVDLIATDPADLAASGGFAACLRQRGVKFAAVWELPSPAATSSKAAVQGVAPSADSAEPALEERPIENDDDTLIQRITSAPELEMPRGEASELTVRLVHELADLEPCEDTGEYRLISNRVDGHLDRLLAMKNYSDAYRAALLFSRHASDPNRSEGVRKEAIDHLRSLFRDEGMIDQLVRSSLGREGLKTIQAVQILASLAPTAVSRLLIEHTKGDRQTQDGVASVLIAMGEGVIPVLADELDSESPGRARRAAKILGDLQHPGGGSGLVGSPATRRREFTTRDRSVARAHWKPRSHRHLGRSAR